MRGSSAFGGGADPDPEGRRFGHAVLPPPIGRRTQATGLMYGFRVFEDRHTAIPEIGLGLTGAGREFRFGWRLVERVPAGLAFELGVEGTRREPAGGDAGPEHGLTVGAGWRLAGRGTGDIEIRLEASRREAANDPGSGSGAGSGSGTGAGAASHEVGLRFTARW